MHDTPHTEGRKDQSPESRLPSLHRRGFLATLLSGAVTLAVQACSRNPPAPAPGATPSTAPSGTPASPTVAATASGTATRLPPAPAASVTALGTQEIHMPLIGAAPHSATPAPTLTPSPSPTETIPPTSTNTPIPEPTHTPGPSPTPVPSPTPRLAATPFPPGPQTRLGLFVGYQHPALEELLRTGNVAFVKTLEHDPTLMQFIKNISPNTIIVARYTPLGQLNVASADLDPIAEARDFVDLLLPVATDPGRRANIDAWESYNEPVVNTREEMQRLAAFEAERTRLLAAEGIRSCIGNFATGTPPLEFWPDFYPAIRAAKEHNGYLGLHEYSAPYMWFGTGTYQLREGQDEGDEGWLTLRYRKVYRDYLQPAGLELPLLITETGIDGGIMERPGPPGLGWADFQRFWEAEGMVRTTAAGFYVEQLAWYDAELREDPYVRGASIYALAAPVGWGSFEIVGGVADLLKQYFSVHPRR